MRSQQYRWNKEIGIVGEGVRGVDWWMGGTDPAGALGVRQQGAGWVEI